MFYKFKKIFKKSYLPKDKISLLKNTKFRVNLTHLNTYLFIYNGTFFSKKYIFFFFLQTKLNNLIMTRKFKKIKPYI